MQLPPSSLLGPNDPPPFTIHNEKGKAPLLLLCDHASKAVPKSLDMLGLTDAELSRFGKAQGVVVKRAFAIKEAVYKALDPWAKRHIGFREVEISGLIENEFGVRTVTGVTADLHRYDIEATWQSVGELIVALARVQLRS